MEWALEAPSKGNHFVRCKRNQVKTYYESSRYQILKLQPTFGHFKQQLFNHPQQSPRSRPPRGNPQRQERQQIGDDFSLVFLDLLFCHSGLTRKKYLRRWVVSIEYRRSYYVSIPIERLIYLHGNCKMMNDFAFRFSFSFLYSVLLLLNNSISITSVRNTWVLSLSHFNIIIPSAIVKILRMHRAMILFAS